MTAGRVVVVSGGSRGLGAVLTQSFLDAGDLVATCSRTETDNTRRWSSESATRDRFLFETCDLADRSEARAFVASVIERFGRIDVLVNNAGVARDGILAVFDDDDIDAVVDLNVKGTIFLSKLVIRRMLPRGEGRVVNISSIVGLTGHRGLTAYGATKAAIDGFTRALAREVGSRQITVNSVAPGYLRTEMTHGLDDDDRDRIARRTPLGRLGEPADVVGAVHFLASDAARFITGQVLVVDGGLTC